MLSIVRNLNSTAPPRPTVSQRLDGLLANLQVEVAAAMQQRSRALQRPSHLWPGRQPGLFLWARVGL